MVTQPLILIVDDDEILRSTFLIYAEKCHIEAHAVSGGEEALAELQWNNGRSFSLILMDCKMPGLDGFECTRRIREMEKESDSRTPIIAVTGALQAGAVERSFEAGMDDFVTKPVTFEQFKVMVTMWLDREARAAEKPAGPVE